MKRTSYTVKTLAAVAPALLLLLSSLQGCTERLETGTAGDLLAIKASLSGTRATLIDNANLGSFTCSAYRTQDGTALFEGKTVSKTTGNQWTIEGGKRYWWKSGESLSFYAVYPQNQTGITKDGITVSGYTVPATADQQQDILLGSYTGTGNAGVAPIAFVHALTALTVTKGNIESSIPGFTAVTSISVDGLYAGGSVSNWTGGAAVSWTGSGSTSFSPSFGDVLTLIPQDLTAKNVTVTVAYSAASGDSSIQATISTGAFEAGKVNNITVNYNSVEVTYGTSSITVPAYGTTGSNEEVDTQEQKQN